MENCGISADEYTWTIELPACRSLDDAHDLRRRLEMSPHSNSRRVKSSLMEMYFSSGDPDTALEIFEQLRSSGSMSCS